MIAARRAGRSALIAGALTSTLVLAACGSTADTAGGTAGAGGVVTDFGVTDTTITLGIMGDTSGPFKNLGAGLNAGNQLWADDVNAAGGICGRQIEIKTVDHGYKADVAKTLYPQLEPQVLGMVQLLGSPVLAALEPNLTEDNMLAAPASWSSEVLDNPGIMMIGTTYDLEIVNGLAYLQQQGLLADGDTIGHIYIDGEYGGNGLKGSQYYAEQNGLTINEAKVTSTDSDLTGIVTGMQGAGVKVIVLTTTPSQTASALAANSQLGLNVPVLGNNPTFDPALLETPARDALGNLYVSASNAPFSSPNPKAVEVTTAYKAAYPDSPRNAGVTTGYTEGVVWQNVLQAACDAGDLSRAGVKAALTTLTSVDSEGLVDVLDYSSPGSPPTRGVYIGQVDETVEGGLREVAPLFTSPEAESYVAPFQQS